jgi:hypothetical protein
MDNDYVSLAYYKHLVTHMDEPGYSIRGGPNTGYVIVCNRCLESTGSTKQSCDKIPMIAVYIRIYKEKHGIRFVVTNITGHTVGEVKYTYHIDVFEKDTYDPDNVDFINSHSRGFRFLNNPDITRSGNFLFIPDALITDLDKIKEKVLDECIETWGYGKPISEPYAK